MSKEKFAFDKTNFIMLGIGMAVVIIGFLLMTGPVSTPTTFEPDIFSVRRDVYKRQLPDSRSLRSVSMRCRISRGLRG